ncbi:hypothetical protein [Mucilaginibacter terrenus]|nr:hypothetical protein [Mucilaginibacter terrenus]
MKQLTKSIIALFASTLLLTASKVSAQDPIMALDPTLMAGWSGNLAYGNSAAHRSTTASKTNFAYTSTPALRQQVVASFSKRLQASSPQGAKALNTAFGPGKADYGQVYQQMLKTSALHDNNAADALAGLLLAGYEIVNQVQDDKITPAMERGTRAQVATLIASNPKMSNAAQRARLSEELKLQTVLLALGWQETLKANTQAAYRQSIASMFQNQYHLDLTQLKLTTNGFAKK